MTVAPVLVAEQLPDSEPGEEARPRLREALREGARRRTRARCSRATAWDAQLIVASGIPVALKKGKPGTPEFRPALRDAIEGLRDFVGSQGGLQP